jgi:hypothetical protein
LDAISPVASPRTERCESDTDSNSTNCLLNAFASYRYLEGMAFTPTYGKSQTWACKVTYPGKRVEIKNMPDRTRNSLPMQIIVGLE